MRRTPQSGYMALISAILISVSLLVMVSIVSFEGFFSRFTVLESQQKEMSAYLAEACLNTAILKIVQDEGYTGNETVPVNDRECEIKAVSGSGFPGDYSIEARGVVNDAITNLNVMVDFPDPPNSYTIDSWEEVGSF